MSCLAGGLFAVRKNAEQCAVLEAQLALARRTGQDTARVLTIMGNLSTGYATLGRENESLRIDREVYATMKKTFGLASGRTLFAAHNLLTTLRTREHTEERAALLREVLPHARERGSENEGLCVRTAYAQHLYLSGSRNDLNEAVAELEDICRISTRLLGAAHPDTRARLRGLEMARNTLARAPPT